MKKSKLTGDIAVMEVSPQSSPGVRTRAAKTLALQRLNKPSSQSAASSSPKAASSSSYLQLRSRRLEKPPILRHLHSGECFSLTNSRLVQDSANSASLGVGEESEKRILGVETENRSVADVKNLLEFGVGNGYGFFRERF